MAKRRQIEGISLFFCAGWLAACSGETPEPAERDADAGTLEVLVDEWPSWVETTDCRPDPVADTPLRRLTREQYANAVEDLFGFRSTAPFTLPPDGNAGPFVANWRDPVGLFHVDRYQTVGEEIAAEVVARLDQLMSCGTPGPECASQFVDRYGEKMFRRPVEADEKAALVEIYSDVAAGTGGPSEGMMRLVATMLQSPDFLYLVEPKDGSSDARVPLTGHEIATRLSFFLWNTLPDDELLEAARTGQLEATEGIRTQAERLLQDPRAGQVIGAFHTQWLGLGRLDFISKNPRRFLRFDDPARGAMRRETERFSDYVVREGDGTLHTLLTARFSFLEEPLFPLYGIAIPADHDASKPVGMLPTQRAGLLTHASVHTALSNFNDTSPVRRGIMLLENFFCYHVKPPDFMVPELPEPEEGLTLRDRFTKHTSIDVCATCHQYIDPLGFGFENYDAVGQYRTTDENGLAVDASGTLKLPEDANEPQTAGPFNGAVELTQKILNSPRVQDCVARQWHRFALQRDEIREDVCAVGHLQQEFIASNYNIRSLILGIVTKDSFRFRPGNTL